MRRDWQNARQVSQRNRQIFGTAAALALLALAATAARSADAEWLDVEGRVQYGYYTEDLRELQNLTASLATAGAADTLRQYYLGLAHYRLAQLTAARDRSRARDSAAHCVSSLEEALQARADFADGLALHAACLRLRAELESLPTPIANSRSRSDLHKALALEPHNPRVLLIDAVSDYERASSAPDRAHALGKLQQAVAAFETERGREEHAPHWGAAEAYAALGRGYLDKGDAIAARGALEHALLLVPDFAYAHRLMARIVSG